MRLSHGKALDRTKVGWRSIKNDNVGTFFEGIFPLRVDRILIRSLGPD